MPSDDKREKVRNTPKMRNNTKNGKRKGEVMNGSFFFIDFFYHHIYNLFLNNSCLRFKLDLQLSYKYIKKRVLYHLCYYRHISISYRMRMAILLLQLHPIVRVLGAVMCTWQGISQHTNSKQRRQLIHSEE